MEIRHGHVRQDLPDEWWEEAGMVGFVPACAVYRANPAPYPVERVVAIPIDHVEPLERKLSHGIFNDSHLFGTARERVVSLLKGFREDAAIPPVHVVRLGPGGPYRFRLNAGAHRFYCAVAAGFKNVSAIDVTDDLL
jgi:hypothetical protein